MAKIIHYRQSDLDKINSFGRRAKSRKVLEGKDVVKLSPEQVKEAWGMVKKHYGMEYITECCGVEVLEPVQDDIARCPECKEMSKVIELER